MSYLYKQEVLSDNPVVRFRLGEKTGVVVNDDVGLTGGIITREDMLNGSSLVMDDNNTSCLFYNEDYIKFSSNIRDRLNNKDAVTVELLIKFNSLSGGDILFSLPMNAGSVAPNICSNTEHLDETSCLFDGICSNLAYLSKVSCENPGLTWTPGVCSDPAFLDEPSCVAGSYVWTPGVCSDPAFLDEPSCVAGSYVWSSDNNWYPYPVWQGYIPIIEIYRTPTRLGVRSSSTLTDEWVAESNFSFSEGDIYHVLAEVDYETGESNLYVNNLLIATSSSTPILNVINFDNNNIEVGYEDVVSSTPDISSNTGRINGYIDEIAVYDKILTEERKTIHTTEAFRHVPPILNSFTFKFTSDCYKVATASIASVILSTEYNMGVNRFIFEYNIERPVLETKSYNFRYIDDNSVTIRAFNFFYTDGRVPLIITRKFMLIYRYELLMYNSYRYILPYYYDSRSLDGSMRIYRMTYLLNPTIAKEYEFNFGYKYTMSEQIEIEFVLPSLTRTSNDGSLDSGSYEIIPMGNYEYDYRITVSEVEMKEGLHSIVIDNGSSISSLFLRFEISKPSSYPSSLIYAVNNSTVKINSYWRSDNDADLIIEVSDIDIDSSISISAFKIDKVEEKNKESCLPATINRPNWSSYINLNSYGRGGNILPISRERSDLVYLDSEEFKILPAQIEGCCILRTQTLCELPDLIPLDKELPDEELPDEPGDGEDPFIFTWVASGSGDELHIKITEMFTYPIGQEPPFGGPDYTIDWGDGEEEEISDAGDIYHEYYPDDGYEEFTVVITGIINKLNFRGQSVRKVSSVIQLGDCGWTGMDEMFEGAYNMASFNLGDYNIEWVETLNQTWSGCTSLVSFPDLDTSNIEEFYQTWFYCTGLTSFPLIDVSSATELLYTWRNCFGLLSFPLIDTSAILTLEGTWRSCKRLTSFPLIDTSNVVELVSTWNSCSDLIIFPAIDTSSALFMNYMLYSCPDLTHLEGDIICTNGQGVNVSSIFRGCTSLVCLQGMTTDSTTITTDMFLGCTALVAPNTGEQAAIEAGSAWTNSSSCP